ncbi:MAG: CcoQ/FixQ family Cbb3-type cytochrome c oxidase assembly chaperone [Thiothrix nivea]|nr:MAG: CcoQ/FixQ family Cbb3-type cytochrome c oxidase assembly chaperone [Thiothrix nivea]
MGNSKIAALIIFFVTFVGILLYVYTGKKRSERLESYRYVPFLDDEDGPKSDADLQKADRSRESHKQGEK